MASYDAVLNIITNGSSKIDKIISKVSQLESIVGSINKKPIDINAASAEKAVDSFWKKTKILDANIQTIQKSSSSASKAFETYSAKLNAANKVLESANPNTKKYAQALESQKRAQNGITQSINDMTKAERDLANAQDKREKADRGRQEAEKAREAARAIRQLADDYLLLGTYQQRSARNGQVLKDQSGVTVSQLTAQANALTLVASNSKVASSEFNRFSIAGQVATGKIYEAQQKKLQALAFGLSPKAPNVNIGLQSEKSISAARSQVAEFVNSYSTIVKSEAAMAAFVARASELRSLVPLISDEWKALRDIIDQVNIDMSAVNLRGQSSSARQPPGLSKSISEISSARGAQKAYLGDLSPAQGIDAIAREFNRGRQSSADSAKNIGDTFADNLRAKASKAASAAASLATSATEAIKKVFGIASPSRFMIEIVKNLADTYVNEMRKAYPRIDAATETAFGEKRLKGNVKGIVATNKGFKEITREAGQFKAQPYAKGFNVAGMTDEFNNMLRTFRNQIAELTTQPEIYSGALNRLPASRITTDLVGLANKRALASEMPSFMPTQRMLGPGELERYISQQLADYLRGIKIPNPWIGPIGDYKKFISTITSTTARATQVQRVLPPSRVAGLLPPSSRVEDRVRLAYQRSNERSAAVMAEGAAVAAQAALPQGETNKIRNAVSGLFDRISSAINGAFSNVSGVRFSFGGGGGGGGGNGGGGGGGGNNNGGNQAARLLGLEDIGNISRISTRELETLSAALQEFRAVLEPTTEGFDRLDNQLRQLQGNIGRQLERRDPNANFLTRRFGPRGASGISEGLIGGAFPLLFGQGLGASIGGGLGGAAGGFAGGGLGFGLSLIGTALGTTLDTLAATATDTGKSLNYPIEGFQKLKDAGLFAGRQQEYYISKLIESGKTTEAAAEIQAQMIKKIGVSGVNNLMKAGQASEELGKVWADFYLQLQAGLAGPMAGLLGWLTSIIKLSTSTGNVQQQARNLNPDAYFKAQSEAGSKYGSMFGMMLDRDNYEKELDRLSANIVQKSVPVIKPIPLPVDPESEEKRLQAQIQAAETVRGLQREGSEINKSADDLRRSNEDAIYDLRKRATDMERDGVEFRRSIEDQIFGKRKDLEQQLLDNDRRRQQNGINAIDLQLQKAAVGLDPIAQSVVNAARDYLRVRGEGEADLQQKQRELSLKLQEIDQETNRYKLQIEDRVYKMTVQRQDYARDVDKARTQMERQTLDYSIKVEEYRLKLAQERFNLALKEGQLAQAQQIAGESGLSGATIASIADTSLNQNARAWLAAIRFAEGTPGANGYRTMFGGGLFSDMSRHPDRVINSGRYSSAAAGAYQFMPNTWSSVGGGAMTPDRQDRAAMALGLRRGVDFSTAPFTPQNAAKIAPEWASFPTLAGASYYGQPNKSFSALQSYFNRAKGQTSSDTYYQPGVGWFNRSTGAMIEQSTGGKAAPQMSMQGYDLQSPPSPPTAPGLPAFPGPPQMVEVNDLMSKYVEIQRLIVSASKDSVGIQKQEIALRTEAARLALQEQVLSPITQFQQQNKELEFEIEKRKTRNRLILEGVAPEIIDGYVRVLELERSQKEILKGLQTQTNTYVKTQLDKFGVNSKLVDSTFILTEASIASLVATTQDTKKQEELRKVLQEILDLRNKLTRATEDTAAAAASAAAVNAANTLQQSYQDEVTQLRMESSSRGAGVAAGFFGQGAQAYESALTKYKDPAMASNIAKASRTNEVNNEIISMRENIQSLIDPTNQVIGGAKAIGDAFSEGFKGVVSGSVTGRDALADFFQKTGQHFLEMATQILAQQLVLKLIGFGLSALNPAAGAAKGLGSVADNLNQYAPLPNAKGNVFTNSIVSSPTLFQFANGGALSNGVMGEAGPEAVLPLSRGPGGRLGVDVSGMMSASRDALQQASQEVAASREALQQVSEGSSSETGSNGYTPQSKLFAESRQALATSTRSQTVTTASSSAPLKIETIRVGSLDVVTVEQAKAIADASSVRGNAKQTRLLQSSPSARRSMGI